MQANVSLTGIILFAHDVERLKDFYINHFQFELIEHDPRMWALLKAGAVTLGLHRVGDKYLNRTDESFKASNNVKFVFEISEDIHEFRMQLTKQDVAMRDIKTFPNYNFWLCDGEDPEGNVFQLKQRKHI